jgi:hypothetical protein
MNFNKFNYTYVVIVIFYVLSFFYFKGWETYIVNGGDAGGYYLYLPSSIIYNDMDSLVETTKALRKYHPGVSKEFETNPLGLGAAHYLDNGKQVIKYTYAVALMYLPFFLIAHFVAIVFGYSSDGFSTPYIFLTGVSLLFYSLLSIFFIYRLLKAKFSDGVVATVIACIFLGTNLYFFVVAQGPMSHPYLFFLYAILIYYTIKWHQRPNIISAIIVGASSGLITIMRPSEIICLLIPLLYSVNEFKNKINLIFFNYKHIVAACVTFLIPIIPQLIYWKYTSGNFLFYSYKGEGFTHIASPYIISGLFGAKNGFFAYTPIMIFAVFGYFFLFKNKKIFFPLFIFICLHVYIIYSWWCWNYINGFGSRPMIETYPILAFPLAYFIDYTFKRKWTRILMIFTVLFFSIHNIFSTYQFNNGILWSEESTWAYNKRIFFRTEINMKDLIVYDTGENYPDAFKSCTLIDKINFDEYKNNIQVASNQENQLFIGGDFPYTPAINITLGDNELKPNDWLKISAYCMTTRYPAGVYSMALLPAAFKRSDTIYKWTNFRIDNKLGNPEGRFWGGIPDKWDNVFYYIQVPKNASPSDVLSVFGWNFHDHRVFIENISVERCAE